MYPFFLSEETDSSIEVVSVRKYPASEKRTSPKVPAGGGIGVGVEVGVGGGADVGAGVRVTSVTKGSSFVGTGSRVVT